MWLDEADDRTEDRTLPGWHLEVNGERIEQLTQSTDRLNLPEWLQESVRALEEELELEPCDFGEPLDQLTDAERVSTEWADFWEAVRYAWGESWERGGVAVDVVAGGEVAARIEAPRRPENRAWSPPD